MRYARDGFAIEDGHYQRTGRPLPAWFLDEPEVEPGEEFFIGAFFELSSCRQIGMGLGPIPWSAIVEYADRVRLAADVRRMFVDVMRLLDGFFLEDAEERAKRERDRAQSEAAAAAAASAQRRR